MKPLPAAAALLLLAAPAPAQEPGAHPLQEGEDLHNSTLLPRPGPAAARRLERLRQALEKKAWVEAARLLIRLAGEEESTLVAVDDRHALGLVHYLARLAALAPPPFRRALAEGYRESWNRVPDRPLTESGRLVRAALDHPFHPPCRPLLLRLADLFLEQGRPDRALSALRRIDLIPPEKDRNREEERVRLNTAERISRLASSPWPVPEGTPRRVAPPLKLSRRLEPRTLEWFIRDGEAEKLGRLRREEDLRRGFLHPRGRMVLCARRVCLHAGTHLWFVDPAAGKRLDPPLRLTDPAPHLPRRLAADGYRLALVAGPRPGPGDRPGGHYLECLRFPPGAGGRGRSLWRHPGRFTLPLPPGLRAEDARMLKEGPLSFGRGPVWIEGDLLVTVYAPLDKTKVSCFLARLDGESGGVRWVRFIAQGAPEAMDPRFDRLAAMPFPHLRGCPILLHRGAAFVATGLGTVHALDAWRGRHLWAYRVARTYPEPGRTRGFIHSRLALDGGRLLAALRESEWLYLFRPFPAPGGSPLLGPPLPRRGLTLLLGLQGRQAYFTADLEGQYCLERITLPAGSSYQSPPLQSGEYFAGPPLLAGDLVLFCTNRRGRHGRDPVDGSLYRVDLTRDLYLELDYRAESPFSLLGPILPWEGGLVTAGWQGFGLWRPAAGGKGQ